MRVWTVAAVITDGDGSFLDKASDLINLGMYVVDCAMKNVSAGFPNIGNSIAAGVTGVAASIVAGFQASLAIWHGGMLWEVQ